MTIQEYFGEWSKVIDLSEADSIIKKLLSVKDIYPKPKDIFHPFASCSLNNLRVVFLGNSPLDFTSHLENIKESIIDYTIPHGIVNFDSSLEKWEAQGVLPIGAALSCDLRKKFNMASLWKPFTGHLLVNLSKYHTGIVYILMGEYAWSFEHCINNKFNHVVRIRHPSWYMERKETMPHDIWNHVNDILVSQNGYGIKWYEEY